MRDFKFAFILGNPRSGTSLFRLMLNAHSHIIAPPECGFMQWWYEKYKDWSAIDNKTQRLEEFLDDLFTSKKIETWQLNEEELYSIIRNEQPVDYNELTSCVYLAYGVKRERAKLLVDKNNYYIHHLDWLKQMWPNAMFIHLVRDGRDVACSYRGVHKLKTTSNFKPQLPQCIEEIAEEWTQNNHRIESEISNFAYHLIRYEDLVQMPEQSLKKVCHFLGLSFEKSMLSYYELKDDSSIEPKETLDWKRKTREMPDTKRIGQFRQLLSKSEKTNFEKISEKQLKLYGYK